MAAHASQHRRSLEWSVYEHRRHRIEYRISVNTIFWGRYYFTIFAGPERRNKRRLTAEGQIRASRQAAFFAVFALLLTSVGLTSLLVFAYLLKSALGIDMSDGDSFLHPLYQWFWE